VLIGGETAEHPGDFPDGEYDLAGFVVGAVERKNIPKSPAIVEGDVLIGLPSSGLHSNGYSLARKILLSRGRLKLNQRLPELGRTLGEELLEPTRIYVRTIGRLLKKWPVKGAAHITGGGIVGNLPRVLPPGIRAVVQRDSWPVPPIFGMIKKLGAVSSAEMDRTFNNGLGMILVVGKKNLNGAMRSLMQSEERCFLIGEVRRGARGVDIV
jgi:phosphoribosylformylglycinamidine cyclo-ligase